MDKAKRIAACVLAVCAAGRVMPVSASEADKGRYTSMIPVRVTDPNENIPDDAVFTLELMPVGDAPKSEISQLEIGEDKEVMFGPLVFSEPGDYEYIIKQISSDDDLVILDDTVYEVKISVFVDDDSTMWGAVSLNIQGKDHKVPVAEFENGYKTTDPPSSDVITEQDSQGRRISLEDSSGSENSDDSLRTDISDSMHDDSSNTDSSVISISQIDSSMGESSEYDVPSGADTSYESEGNNSDSGGADTPVTGDSSDTGSSDLPDTSGSEETSSLVEQSSYTGSDTSQSSSSGGSWFGSLTSPNTGGKAAALSGLLISAAAVALTSVRRRHSSDDDTGGGTS